MREVVCEAQMFGIEEWKRIGSVAEPEPPGSLSSDDPDRGRRVFMFGWYDDVPGVWESDAGADAETPEARLISTAGFSQLSNLAEPYELEIHRPTGRYRVRFSLAEGALA